MRRRRYPKKKKWGQFASPLEQDIWNAVDSLKNKKFKIEYETERLKYFIVKNYKPDMILTFPDGRKMYIEVKGFLRYEDQVKMRAVKNANPELDIRFVFPEKGRVGGSNMTPMQWCEKYSFPCTMSGRIPNEWLKNVKEMQQVQGVKTTRRLLQKPRSRKISVPRVREQAISTEILSQEVKTKTSE